MRRPCPRPYSIPRVERSTPTAGPNSDNQSRFLPVPAPQSMTNRGVMPASAVCSIIFDVRRRLRNQKCASSAAAVASSIRSITMDSATFDLHVRESADKLRNTQRRNRAENRDGTEERDVAYLEIRTG